ncbi:MAG: hypothetical protein HDQ98_16340 [Lachnospiraceae bacterium]|nr:hypothetical protein [Lachnospiraceae bacterium]
MKERVVRIKKIGIYAGLAVFVVLIASGAFHFVRLLNMRSENTKDRWGLGLPDGLERVYHKQTESFRGDGWHYDVYSVQAEETWLENLHTEADIEVEEFYDSAAGEIHVEHEYYSYLHGSKYKWKRNESEDGLTQAVAIYDIGRGYLYVVAYSI